MRTLTLSIGLQVVIGLGSFGLQASAAPGKGARTTTASASMVETAGSTSGPPANKCGCYEDSTGACHCAKKNQCGCPGECEPAGCEEKRQKQLEKEAQEEVKRQQQEEKKRDAELTKKRDELDKKDAEKRERGLRGLRLIEQQKQQNQQK